MSLKGTYPPRRYLLEAHDEAVVRWAKVSIDGLDARPLSGRVFHSTFLVGGGTDRVGSDGQGGEGGGAQPSGDGEAASDERRGVPPALFVAGANKTITTDQHELLVFGGQQLGLTNGYLDSWFGRLTIVRFDSSSESPADSPTELLTPPGHLPQVAMPSSPPTAPDAIEPANEALAGTCDRGGGGAVVNVGDGGDNMAQPLAHDAQSSSQNIVSCTIEWRPGVRSRDGSDQPGLSRPGQRRGHTTYAVGRRLLCFGGAIPPSPPPGGTVSTSCVEPGPPYLLPPPPTASSMGPGPQHLAESTVFALNGGTHWSEHRPCGEAPQPRRGHGLKLHGGSLLVSGGFDSNGARLDDRIGYRLKFIGGALETEGAT